MNKKLLNPLRKGNGIAVIGQGVKESTMIGHEKEREHIDIGWGITS